MDLNTRLLDALTDIERHLFAAYPTPDRGSDSFREAVSRAHGAGKLADRDLADLQDLRDLRNLLSHSRWEGRTPVTASVAGVTRAEQLNEQLTGKIPRVAQLLAAREVTSITPTTTVEQALETMQRHDYSCLPVIDPDVGFRGLLSSHDLVCWLGARLTTDLEVTDIPVDQVMHTGGPDHIFARRDLPQRDARQAFIDHLTDAGNPLSAILVTMTGHDHEPLLGILTPWDLAYLTP